MVSSSFIIESTNEISFPQHHRYEHVIGGLASNADLNIVMSSQEILEDSGLSVDNSYGQCSWIKLRIMSTVVRESTCVLMFRTRMLELPEPLSIVV